MRQKVDEMNTGPLPMSVVTGYLGAGKTTFVNRMLSASGGRRITVLVNDFGEISLDEALIANRDGDVIALANGCMCCQIGGDLYRTIDRILSMRERIDHLVVETSGVADPSKISQIAVAEPDLALSGTLVLVDTENFLTQMQDQVLRDTLERQLRNADLILMTKCDLAGEDRVGETILAVRDVSSDGEMVWSAKDACATLFCGARVNPGKRNVRVEALRPHKVPFDSWTWKGSRKPDRDRLIALLNDETQGVYRAKGHMKFKDGRFRVVNKVGGRIDIDPPGFEGDSSVITVIGKRPDFDRERFAKAWDSLISEC